MFSKEQDMLSPYSSALTILQAASDHIQLF